MNQARAVLWAQFRSMRNHQRRGGAIWSIVMNVLWYGAWAAAGFLAQTFLSEPEILDTPNVIAGALLVMFLYWQVVPLLVAASGASLDLKKIQAYPISTTQLFGLEVLLRTTSAIEMLMVVIGMAIGLARNPALPLWAPLGLAPFIILNLLIALVLRDLLIRLMSIRRIREIAAILFVGLATIPQLMLRRGFGEVSTTNGIPGSGGRRGPGMFRWIMESNTSEFWPWTATANLIFAPSDAPPILVSLAILTGWVAVAGLIAAWQFEHTLRFDAQAARASGGPANNDRTLMDRFYALPSLFLGDPMAMMIEKELRYLIRSPRFRLVFLMGCTFGLIVSRAFGGNGVGTSTASYLPDSLTSASIYSLLLLGEVCFWNSFGFDRSAAQIYFLAPVRFRQVLIAKNITALFFVSMEILCAATLLALLRVPVDASRILDAFVVTGVVCLYLLAAGNIMSVRNPRSTNPQSSLKTSSSGRTQFMLLALYPITFLPAALAYLARWAFDSNAAFFAVLGVMGGMGMIFYHYSLESASDSATERREQIVSALSTGEGPIAT